MHRLVTGAMEEVKHGQNMPEQRSKQGSQGRLSEELVSS